MAYDTQKYTLVRLVLNLAIESVSIFQKKVPQLVVWKKICDFLEGQNFHTSWNFLEII